jgi:polar amino acid transport system substrate-binding protein
VTAEFEPFSAPTGELAPGALAEVVQAMSAKMGTPVTVEFFPWNRAKQMPIKLSRIAIIPLTRTPEREANYRWPVEIYRQDFGFMSRKDSSVAQLSVDQLRKLRIGTLLGTASHEQLQRNKFAAIVTANTHEELWRMLDSGMIDALYGGEAIEKQEIRTTGRKAVDYVYGPALDQGPIWVGGSLDFTDADVTAWQAAFKAVKLDGTYARILRKYGLPE